MDDEGWRVMRRYGTYGRHGGYGRFGRAALAAGAALCAVAALPEVATAAGTPNPYAFVEGAKPVTGTASNTDAAKLDAGSTYKSTSAREGTLYYRLELDAKSNAYVSVTAVPPLGTKVAYGDGLTVSVQDGNGTDCSSGQARFGAATSPRPITAWAARRIGPDKTMCQEAGTYYVVVERTRQDTSTPGPWDLEIQHVSEPGLAKAGSTTPPETWNSASPEPLSGDAQQRTGGSSFSEAVGLEQGVWSDQVKPGQTLYYRVPVDWGQQLSARAELGSSAEDGYVPSALEIAVYNPVRGFVTRADTQYDGKQKSAALDPLPPVAYPNRYETKDDVSGMRFGGWYYLTVHLSPEMATKYGQGPIRTTLRVKVSGTAQSGPEYAGTPVPADVFEVSDRDKEIAASGRTEDEAARSDTMRLVAAGAIGAGVVLVVVLAVWTLTARKRAAAVPQGGTPPTGYGPPGAW
ncbi:hypothetical protein ACFVT5_27380 [Streptomyces sp. NPDC058001]|uniref:hypothetical protein n=1 Tax=Streptomyces sp. NPDC058001 TaxID=3346300 RepID=UPI0036EDF233